MEFGSNLPVNQLASLFATRSATWSQTSWRCTENYCSGHDWGLRQGAL